MRIGVADQHGAVRCKFVSTHDFLLSLRNGIDVSGAILGLDTANKVFPPAFVEGGGFGIPELTGFPDVVLVPDPTTFQILPWANKTAWVLSDAYFSNGKPVELNTSQVLRRQRNAARELGFEYAARLDAPGAPRRRGGPGLPVPLREPPGPDQRDPVTPCPITWRRSGCPCAPSRTSGAPARPRSASTPSWGWGP